MNTKQRNEKAANFPSLVYYNRWRTRTFESVKKNQALKSAAGGHKVDAICEFGRRHSWSAPETCA